MIGCLWIWLRSQRLLLATVLLYAWAFAAAPEKARAALGIGTETFLSVVLIIGAVFGLMGLFQVWVNRDKVAHLLGREGGWRALLLSAFTGTVLIGPPFIVFPLLATLREKGARWAVVVTVLAAWSVKVPMIPLEVQFLGGPFSATRIALTLLFSIPLGLAVESIMERGR